MKLVGKRNKKDRMSSSNVSMDSAVKEKDKEKKKSSKDKESSSEKKESREERRSKRNSHGPDKEKDKDKASNGGNSSDSVASPALSSIPEPTSPISPSTTTGDDLTLLDLEHKLKIELDIRNGAENLYRSVTKKKEKEVAWDQLEKSSKSVEQLREKIASIKKQQMTRVGQSHSLADLFDMVEVTTLTEAEMELQKDMLLHKIEKELKVKAGAENLAKVYGTSATGDKKLINQVFTKLMETNSKIALLKVAVEKYERGLSLIREGKLRPKKSATGAGIIAFPPEENSKKSNIVSGKFRVTIAKASNLCPPHKRLDLRCEIKIDNVTKAKTSVKQRVTEAAWNDDFTLDLRGASDIEFHIFDDKNLYAILFFDVRNLTEESQTKVILLEPRGEITLTWSFVRDATKGMKRRGAVKKPMLPRAFMKYWGYQATIEMATKLQHDQSSRRREHREQGLSRSKSFREKDKEIFTEEEMEVMKRRVPTMDDFLLLKVLGKGNFGKVMLVEEKTTKNVYAIKVLKKEFVIENDEIESVKAEKRVFQLANKADHPFLVKLHSCFQTRDRIFFVMEYVSGGDLMMHIQRAIFPESRAKMYLCEVLLALEYLHSHNIVYRDLKLDNILLGLDGHIKVADYGLCKENMRYGSTTNTFCGTPEFMAPEILLEKPYTRAVDWWAFGVLVYEMLLAQSPFKGDEEEQIFDSILDSDVYYPSRLHPDAVDLLQKLLERDPTKRLGAGTGDAAEVKAHPYFKNVDWKAILEKRVEPNFKPTVSSAKDTNNFDPEFTREVPCITPCEVYLDDVDQEEFHGFSYVADFADRM